MNHEHILNKKEFDGFAEDAPFRPVQVGRIVCGAGYVVGKHTHLDWFELTVVTDGEGIIETDGERLEISRGDIYLSFPCEVHSIISSTKHPLKYDFLSFVPLQEDIRADFDDIVSKASHFSHRKFRQKRIAYLVDGCIGAYLACAGDENEYFTLAVRLIIKEIIRLFKTAQLSEQGSHISGEQAVCNKVAGYIDTHIFSLKSLTVLSEISGYNYSYLSSMFKRVTGETISDYCKKTKLEQAKILLSQGDRSITEISLLLGYSSVYAFSNAFKNETGYSPGKFRNIGRLG